MSIRASLSVLAALAAIATTTPASASSYRVLYSFKGGNDGALPAAGLINVGGTLYGTTYLGGTAGTVFSVNPKTGAESVVYSFHSNNNGIYDGADPVAGLIDVDGMLYGTTPIGGAIGFGTVFSVNPKSGTETVVYSFGGDLNNGTNPVASLINVGGTLYGTTLRGGCSNTICGTVFPINPTTGAEAIVYPFTDGADGAFPGANLINNGGTLYGTTETSGQGSGTVFAVNPTTGAETVLHTFGGSGDGAVPVAGLINVGGTLFGTTQGGDTNCFTACGTVFSVNPKTGAETVVYAFKGGRDGGAPSASLINVGGTLYGTTQNGGAGHCSYGCGTVFRLNPKTGAEKVVYSFKNGTDGAYPRASLINVGGTLYGTTYNGGTGTCHRTGCGTVFAYTP